ncbi:MAG: holo-ACP synthase [Piscinibacter sp.]|nr:holo-ACP synthase [Piscinibacter sp.]
MIFGIGTDICDLRRLRQTWARRGERFAQRVLGPHELEVFRSRLARVEARGIAYLGTRFSAKEAFSKAIGLGMRMPMTWRGCEVVKDPRGKPEIRLHGALAEWFEARGLVAHVSVTDETDYAAAFVVVETKEPR